MIDLKYLYKGAYDGLAKYHDWTKQIDSKAKAAVFITLHLNDDLNTGSGTYMYKAINDYGVNSFQINSIDPNKVIIRYKNVIPSGIADGYEIWEKE